MALTGTELAARFSLATSRLRYCGPEGSADVLYRTVTSGEGIPETGKALLEFEALEPYLRAIAKKHGLRPLDLDVVEAYWIGNSLLDAFTPDDFRSILDAFRRRGLPARVADGLAARLPRCPIPHHAFHVMFVGVGAVTGKVPTTLANMESCRVSWGRVIGVEGTTLRLVRRPLTQIDGKFALDYAEEASYAYDPAVLPDVAEGDWVALHWGWPAMVLTWDRVARLHEYTVKALASVHEATDGSRVREK